MDHFNATIKDGKLVNTRRGLQVSKQKHNGLSFVNAYPQETSSRLSSPAHRGPRPSQRQAGVTESDGEAARGASNAQQREDVGHLEFSFVPHTIQGPRRRRRGTQKEPLLASPRGNLLPRLAPISAEDGTTQPSLVGGDANTLQRGPSPGRSVTYPSASVAGDADAYLSEASRELFDRHFAHLPRNMYPYEDMLAFNPARGGDFYAVVTGDIAAFHCVLMCGTITEAVINSDTDPNDFAYHMSKICALLNQKLSHNYAADVVTLHCIASLAWMGCYVGRLDHWHMHMRGLQKVLDVNGGLAGLPPWLLTGMYKADLKGATALASSPYLPFTRHYSSISTVLPPEVPSRTFSSISALLAPLHIDREVIDALSSLSLFASAIRLARHFAGSVTFDPHSFTEEWLAITHTLLTCPRPLQEKPPGSENDPFSSAPCSSATTDEGSGSHAQNHIAAHRLRPSASITPSPWGPPGVEPALRIAALLFLKELLPDWPRNLGGYAVLLDLLRQHLHEIVRIHGRNIPPPPQEAARREPSRPAASGARATPQPPEHGSSLRNPLFRAPTVATNPSSPPELAKSSPPTLRPVIVLLALIGDLASRQGNINEHRTSKEEQYPRAIYRDILRDVAGLGDAADIDRLEDETDLALVTLFPLVVRDLDSVEGRDSVGWDEGDGGRELLRGIIVGGGEEDED